MCCLISHHSFIIIVIIIVIIIIVAVIVITLAIGNEHNSWYLKRAQYFPFKRMIYFKIISQIIHTLLKIQELLTYFNFSWLTGFLKCVCLGVCPILLPTGRLSRCRKRALSVCITLVPDHHRFSINLLSNQLLKIELCVLLQSFM